MHLLTRLHRSGLLASAVLAFAAGSVHAFDEDTEPPLYPSWSVKAPDEITTLTYDAGLSETANGQRLKSAIQDLVPGDFLLVGPGTYSVDSLLDISKVATAAAPIRIVGAPGKRPVITRPNNGQNTINFGTGGSAAYLVLSGFELTGGDIGVRLHDVNHMVVDNCRIHGITGTGIAVKSHDVSHIHLIGNEITGTGGSPAGPSAGEGIYVGGNFGNPVAHDMVIARNWVHHTSGTQGDGIEIKQGSWGNWVMDNVIHDTPYPGLIAYGTGGKDRNVLARNVIWNSGDVALQVQGEAIVRNNLAVAGDNGAFLSWDHQDLSVNLEVTHNTFVGYSEAARLKSWSGRPGMVFANNACYSKFEHAIRFENGSTGVAVAGNVAFGAVQGLSSGYQPGTGLNDFVGGSWKAENLLFFPKPGGVLAGSGSVNYSADRDILGTPRLAPFEAGAAELF
ncbi:MAG: right-handed parallel beta-helix repeat-containing protein [Planctomycetota bacterium]